MAAEQSSATNKAGDKSSICAKCLLLASNGEHFLFASAPSGGRHRHQESYLLLSLSARAGCGFCRLMSEVLLDDAISRATVVDLFTSKESIIVDSMALRNIGIDDSYISVSARMSGEPHASSVVAASAFLHFYTNRDNPAAQDPRIVGRSVFGHSGSQECLSLMSGWLKECSEFHENCSKSVRSLLPSRVIDLGSLNGPLSPKMLLSKEKHGLYATLSHCWGPKEILPLMTTTQNFEKHRAGISIADLPLSFHNAMILSRSLGLRYLWIDSLCIVQNSPTDWSEQSALMASIYGQSHINISAAAAGNSREGIFKSRSIPQPSCRIPYKSRYVAVGGEIFIRALLKAYVLGNEFNHTFNTHEKFSIDPLFTRAWVLQERMLSPRNIHFGSGELLWECQTLTAHESKSKSTPASPDAELKRMLAPEMSKNIHLESSSYFGLTREIHTRWLEIVGAYSRLDLSYENDKFPAISGLAREFQRQTGDCYLAGLWRSDLHRALLWRPAAVDNISMPSNLLRRRPKQWRAPSWSWASWEGYIDASLVNWHYRVEYEYDASVIEVEVVPADKDVMGRLKGGQIKIRGLWSKVRLGNKGVATFRMIIEGGYHNTPGQFALLDQPDETNRGSRYSPLSDLTGSFFDCVQVGIWNDHQPSNEHYKKSDDILWCLLLQPAKGNRNCYCRVGIAYIRLEQVEDLLRMSNDWRLTEFVIV